MAPDLIPPPSPAGRPDRERPGGKVHEEDPPPRATQAAAARHGLFDDPADEHAAAPGADAPLPPAPGRSRFGFFTGTLLGIGVAAVAAAVIGLSALGSGGDEDARWSAFRPPQGDAVQEAKAIAKQVSGRYLMGNGDELVAVRASEMEIRDTPLEVYVREPGGADSGDIETYGDGVLYEMVGLGKDGAIRDGQPSAQRLSLLRREALELALYTFRYVDVDEVTVLLPAGVPPATAETVQPGGAEGEDPEAASAEEGTAAAPAEDATPEQRERDQRALFFKRSDLEDRLEVPLEQTVGPVPPRPETLRSEEQELVDQLTARNLFGYQFEPSAVNDRIFLVLDELPDA